MAGALNLNFIDLDTAIEAQSEMPIPEIFSSEGESGFREREHLALQSVLTSKEQVIALGGGALTIPRTRELAEANGDVILLNAPQETLLARLQNDSIERPLLRPSTPLTGQEQGPERSTTEDKLRALLEQRGDHYASFPVQIDTSGKSPAQIAWDIQILMGCFREPETSG